MAAGPPDSPLLIAHRGGAELAPENTLAAFRQAVDDWAVDMIERDVRLTADGSCVVIHDPTVDRTTDGTGAVAAMTLAEVRELDAGYRFSNDGGRSFPFRGRGERVPTLDEVLEALPDTRFTFEIKAPEAQRPLFEAVRRHAATDRVIIGALHDSERAFFGDYPGQRSASMEEMGRFYVLYRAGLGRLAPLTAGVFQVPEVHRNMLVVTSRFVRLAHARGRAVHVWTVNSMGDMMRLLKKGVDGIMTDRPDRLAQLLTRFYGRPPAPFDRGRSHDERPDRGAP